MAGLSAEENAKAWSGRRVLVTGVGGFIGSHVAETLVQAGASVRAFVRYVSRGDYGWLETSPPEILEELEIFRGDLANPEAVVNAVAGREIVLHLGALVPIPYSYRHPREFVTANLEGTLNVLEAVRREEIARIVHISTSEVYGTAMRVPIDEEHPLHPQSPYAATKVGADQLALSYQRSFGTPVVILRPFNTYGPRQSARAVIPTIIAQALSREEIKLGATSPTRDFLYVADTVQGLLRCATAEGIEGETINLGTGVEVSIGDLAQRILRLLGVEVPIALDEGRLRPPNSEVERLVADVSKAKRLLAWQPEVTLDEGLRRTIEWLTGSLSSYKTSVYNI
ncbi:MAG TPA: GDP-mannose 4,6-dehydratase [Gaiellaceae bacterium]|nr:GDP-mannose 4,6-dehydratase [Gaiellaceae bacterium]